MRKSAPARPCCLASSGCYFEQEAATIFTDSTVSRCDPADDVLVDEPALVAAAPVLDEEPVLEEPEVADDPVGAEPVVPESLPAVEPPDDCPAEVVAELDSTRPVISTC